MWCSTINFPPNKKNKNYWFLKLSVTQRNEITDRTEHTMIVPFIVLDYASPPPCCCCGGNVNMKWPDTGKCRHQLGSHSLSAVSTHWRPAIVCKKIYLEISVKENVLLIYSKKCCKTWKTILFSKLSLKSDLPLSALFKSNICKGKRSSQSSATHNINITYFDIGSKQKIRKVLLWFARQDTRYRFPLLPGQTGHV